jgi:hypothetical protein
VDYAADEHGHVELRADTPHSVARSTTERRSTKFAVIVLRDEDKAAAREAFSTAWPTSTDAAAMHHGR